MDMKELNKRIASLKKRNESIVAEVQTLGLACLEQVDKHGNTTPINDLIGALTRSQVQAFVEWSLAFGKVKAASIEKRKAGQYLAYDSTKATDLEGAQAKVWDSFAPEKDESTAKAFDLQAAVKKLLKKAAESGQVQESVLKAIAAAAGIEKLPVVPVTAQAAEAAVGEAII